MYFPQEPAIQVHQTRVCACPVTFPPEYYWYDQRQYSPGPPRWAEQLVNDSLGMEPQDDDLQGEDKLNDHLQGEVDLTATLPMGESESDASTPQGVEHELAGHGDVQHRSKGKYTLRSSVKPPNKLYSLSLEASSK